MIGAWRRRLQSSVDVPGQDPRVEPSVGTVRDPGMADRSTSGQLGVLRRAWRQETATSRRVRAGAASGRGSFQGVANTSGHNTATARAGRWRDASRGRGRGPEPSRRISSRPRATSRGAGAVRSRSGAGRPRGGAPPLTGRHRRRPSADRPGHERGPAVELTSTRPRPDPQAVGAGLVHAQRPDHRKVHRRTGGSSHQ